MRAYAPQQADAAFARFVRAEPAYEDTTALDELRASDYRRLDECDQVYLDYTGGSLYAERQLIEHLELLRGDVFGNPHSINPTSAAATALVEQARGYVLSYFNADPDEYLAVFTANATGALRVVGEAYPFTAGDRYLLTFDNHNSVNGIREFARARGAETIYIPFEPPDLRFDDDLVIRYLDEARGAHNSLFAYPAQSNFSGVQHPLEWIEAAHERGWDVIVDCAAFVPTNRLDLSEVKPDFVPISFYKLFGYPTGIGCLLARREACTKLHRPWFSGGTITAATVQGDWYSEAPGAAVYEDGTVNYLGLPAIEIGLRHVESIGIETIHTRVTCLGRWLLEGLAQLRHANGEPVVQLYGPRSWDRRGATITFNFLHPDGEWVDERHVDRVASRHNISVRTGCFCNSGTGEVAFSVEKDLLVGGSLADNPGMTFDAFIHFIGLPSAGAVRVSLGIASSFADVYRFMDFACEFVDLVAVDADLPQRAGC